MSATVTSEPGPSFPPLAVEFIGVGMRFGSFQALADVNLRLERHRFHVILGENGAGKSTLVKCLIGYQRPTSGQIVVADREVNFASPKEAHQAGLGMVYQHFTLADNLTVAENFLLSMDNLPNLLPLKQLRRQLSSFINTMPIKIDLDRQVGSLAAGEKQKLEILIQLQLRRKILILDEPSSVLTPQEADDVFRLLADLVKRKELTVVLITHKFREFEGFGDTVSVLRKGKLVAHGEAADYTRSKLAELMLGSPMAATEQGSGVLTSKASNSAVQTSKTLAGVLSSSAATGAALPGLSVSNLSLDNARGGAALKNLELRVEAGKIHGIAGVSGNGQRELVEVFMGLHPSKAKHLELHGKSFLPTAKGIREAGLGIIPELPLKNACVSELSLWENLSCRQDYYNRRKLKTWAEELKERFRIKASSLESPIKSLSGGNVQRAVLARELRPDTRAVVAANPCFGLDFQASKEVRQRLREMADSGAAVLLLSEDLDEVLEMSDQISVIFEGKILYSCTREQIDLARIGQAMAGTEPSHVPA